MDYFTHPAFDHHEQVVFFSDAATGLRAIVAIHDTTLGPALGGVRMFPYADTNAALTDVLRLSRGMTYKSALAGLELGGGKAVLIGDPRKDKRPDLVRALGRCIERLGGHYIAAEDSGTSVDDVALMAQTTSHVSGLAPKRDSSGLITQGDPSPWTAYGVYVGLKAAVKHKLGREDLDGLHVAIQGVGNVGRSLARLLHAGGVRLSITHVFDESLQRVRDETGASVVAPEAIYTVDADVFAPCALGGIVNDDTVDTVAAPIVAGAANNQLATPAHGDRLHARGILYAPDYVINAGGIINIAHENGDYDQARAFAHVARIGETLTRLFERADAEGLAPHRMADSMAQEVIATARADASRLAA